MRIGFHIVYFEVRFFQYSTIAIYRELNNKLVPIMMDRLHHLHKQACLEKFGEGSCNSVNFSRPFAHLAKEKKDNSGLSADIIFSTLLAQVFL